MSVAVPCAARKREETRLRATVEQPHREEHQHQAKGQRTDDHAPGIELEMLLVPRADAGHADDEQRHDLTMKQITVLKILYMDCRSLLSSMLLL